MDRCTNVKNFFRIEDRRAATLKEKLAELAHEQWSDWMKYFFSKCQFNKDGTATIPAWAVKRWQDQMNASYSELTETEKDSDREEADRVLRIFNV